MQRPAAGRRARGPDRLAGPSPPSDATNPVLLDDVRRSPAPEGRQPVLIGYRPSPNRLFEWIIPVGDVYPIEERILRRRTWLTAVLAVLVITPAVGTSTAASAATADRSLVAESALMAPQPPQLSAEEKRALEQERRGQKVTNPMALKSAKQKLKTAEKYRGERNKQKRKG